MNLSIKKQAKTACSLDVFKDYTKEKEPALMDRLLTLGSVLK